MAIDDPIPGTPQESVVDKWQKFEQRKKKDSPFLPMNTVNNITKKIVKGGNDKGNGGKGGKNNGGKGNKK